MQDRYGVSSSEDLGISDISGCFGVSRCLRRLYGTLNMRFWDVRSLGCSDLSTGTRHEYLEWVGSVHTAVKRSDRQQCSAAISPCLWWVSCCSRVPCRTDMACRRLRTRAFRVVAGTPFRRLAWSFGHAHAALVVPSRHCLARGGAVTPTPTCRTATPPPPQRLRTGSFRVQVKLGGRGASDGVSRGLCNSMMSSAGR